MEQLFLVGLVQFATRFSIGMVTMFGCPVESRNRTGNGLDDCLGQWNRDPMDIDVGTSQGGKLDRFVIDCAFLVALCRSLLIRIVERSTVGGRSFAKVGPLALIKPQVV
jgi:hypothetical protein